MLTKVCSSASLEKKARWNADSLATASAKSPSTFCNSVWAVLILSVISITDRMRTAQTKLQMVEGDLAEAVKRLSAFQCIFISIAIELHTLAMLAKEYEFESWIRVSARLPTFRHIDLKAIAEGAGLRNLLLEWLLKVASCWILLELLLKEAGCYWSWCDVEEGSWLLLWVMLKNAKFGKFYNSTIQTMRLLT